MNFKKQSAVGTIVAFWIALLPLHPVSAQSQGPFELERSARANGYGRDVREAQELLERITQNRTAILNKQLRALNRFTSSPTPNGDKLNLLTTSLKRTRDTLLQERFEALRRLKANNRITQQAFDIIRINLRRGLLGVPILFASYFANSVAEAGVLVTEFDRKDSKLRPILNALKFKNCKQIQYYKRLLNTGTFINILSARLSTQQEPELGDPLVERIRLGVLQASLECELLKAVEEAAPEPNTVQRSTIGKFRQPLATDTVRSMKEQPSER